MFSSLKKSILLLVTMWTISVAAQAAYFTLCRRCDNTHVSYTYDSPAESIHVQAEASADSNCSTRTTARSAEGFVFEDEAISGTGTMNFVVSAPGFGYTCRNYNSLTPCCTGSPTV
jgi:hypothetical protein